MGGRRRSLSLRAGLSTPDLKPSEHRAITEWYEGKLRQVPESVSFAARYDARFRKNYRAKGEGAFRGGPPQQLMPYMALPYYTICGFRAGSRENAPLARAWGVRPNTRACHNDGGPLQERAPAISVATEGVRDIFETWEYDSNPAKRLGRPNALNLDGLLETTEQESTNFIFRSAQATATRIPG